jgi:hypothetical protein
VRCTDCSTVFRRRFRVKAFAKENRSSYVSEGKAADEPQFV